MEGEEKRDFLFVTRFIEKKVWIKLCDLYGGIEGFREIVKDVPCLSGRDMNFACIAFGLKKEDLKCYTRKLLRIQLFNF